MNMYEADNFYKGKIYCFYQYFITCNNFLYKGGDEKQQLKYFVIYKYYLRFSFMEIINIIYIYFTIFSVHIFCKIAKSFKVI